MAIPADDNAKARFQELLTEHRGIVLKVAHAYCRSPADRDDLSQEIAAQLWRAFPRYDASRRFSTWMYRIALNVAISQLRRARHPARSALPLDEATAAGVAAPAAPEPDPRIAALDRFIAQLDPLNRALLVLYLEERSYREIAEVLGITETNVATKISRLKQLIRREMPTDET